MAWVENDTIAAIFKAEQGRVLAILIKDMGDFDLAEDALQDALVVALERWPSEGLPQNPGAWMTTIARRRAIDRLRREATFERHKATLYALETHAEDEDERMPSPIPDERLRLMFTCCHPALALEAQVALTLRTLGGLSTEEVARAFLVPLPTMAQRLARAKNKIRAATIPYAVPPAELLPERLEALLAVIYLIFNEGYVATSGTALMRTDLCQEAIRLARVLVALLPQTAIVAEAQGLLALMLLHDARRAARVDAQGNLVLLEDQQRVLWNRGQIEEGSTILQGALAWRQVGGYQLQAAISAVHGEARHAEETDWPQIVALYHLLVQMQPSPVVKVNRAVAVAMVEGAFEGLRLLHGLEGDMERYYPYHVARADLLRRTKQREAAADAYQRALELCQNQLEAAYLQRRYQELDGE